MLDYNKVQKNIIKVYLRCLKQSKGSLPTFSSLRGTDSVVTTKAIRYWFTSLIKLQAVVAQNYPKEFLEFREREEKVSTAVKLMREYGELLEKKGRPPTRQEFSDYSSLSERTFYSIYSSINSLAVESCERFPEYSKNLLTSDTFKPARLEEIKEEIGCYDKFVITTAISGCSVNKKGLATLRSYCEINSALLLILPQADPARPKQGSTMYFDPVLKDDIFIFDQTWLNKSVYISNILTSAKQINPTTGLKRIGPRIGAAIMAGPKQVRDPVSNNHNYPKHLLVPGAITDPDYTSKRYLSQRTASIADSDHEMGGVVVEIQDNKIFHARHIKFDDRGEMYDKGWHYKPCGSIEWYGCDGIVFSDLHVDELDPVVDKAWQKSVSIFKPKQALVFHDSFNGSSCSFFASKKKVESAVLYQHGLLSVEREVKDFISKLREYTDLMTGDCMAVKVQSNHDERLSARLEDGVYPNDQANFRIMHEAAIHKFDGKDPLEELCRSRGMDMSKIVWMKRDQSYKIGIFECGWHGDVLTNGARTNDIKKYAEDLGPCIFGHGHSSAQKLGCVRVGTSTGIKYDDPNPKRLRPAYQRGTNAADNSIAVVYPNNTVQLMSLVSDELFADFNEYYNEEK